METISAVLMKPAGQRIHSVHCFNQMGIMEWLTIGRRQMRSTVHCTSAILPPIGISPCGGSLYEHWALNVESRPGSEAAVLLL